MTKVKRTELDTLLVHLVRCPAVTLKALDRLVPNDFDDATELPHKLIWKISSDFYRKFKTVIPASYMADKLSEMSSEVPMLADPQISASVQTMLDTCYTRLPDHDLIAASALETLANLLFERHALSEFDKTRQESGMTPDKWEELNTRRRTDAITGASVTEPFSDTASCDIRIEPRQEIGINFLDTLLGGGMRLGEVMGFLAPSGGGKTTFSNQVAISYSKRAKHTFVFTYEEPISDEYLQPVWACASGLPRSAFEKLKNFNELPADQLKQFQRAKDAIGGYLHYIDMSGAKGTGSGFGGIKEIETILLEYKSRGIVADAIIIDWFWPMFKRWTATTTRTFGESSGEERGKAQICTDEIKQLCGKYHCWAWVNQQATPSEAKKKKKMEQQDSAELKSFSWFMNGCLALNTLEEDKLTGILNYSKARSVRKGSIYIQLKGEIATFVPCDEDSMYDPLQSKLTSRNKFNKPPRERTPVQPVEPSMLEKNYAGQ